MPTEYDEWGDPIIENETPTENEIPTDENPPVETEQTNDDEPLIVADWNLTEAREYVRYNAIDNEDFLDGDETQQVRFLNVAKRTLTQRYRNMTIPNEAVYLFAATLNANFNDTAIMAQRGIASFNVSGIGFTFKDWAKKELSGFITEEITTLIEEANGGDSGSGGRVKWVTL